MSRRFKLARGGVRATLDETEVEFLRSLPEQLRPIYEGPDPALAGGLQGGPGDPVRERLFPRAYLDPTAEEAEAEWRALVHPELLRERLAALELLSTSLESPTGRRRGAVSVDLTEDDVAAWLGVLNDSRLALGLRLEVSEDTDFSRLDPNDARSQGLTAYAWLTELQVDLVETQLDRLGD